MFRRCSQNPAHVTALCVARANAVGSIGESDIPINADVNDDFGLSRKTMNVARLMVLRINFEQGISEAKRRHESKYNPSPLGYQAPSAGGTPITNVIWLRGPEAHLRTEIEM